MMATLSEVMTKEGFEKSKALVGQFFKELKTKNRGVGLPNSKGAGVLAKLRKRVEKLLEASMKRGVRILKQKKIDALLKDV
jgi:hypothetical protein